MNTKSSITSIQLEQLDAMLSNDENSSDDELRELMRRIEIPKAFIEQAISIRNLFFTNPLAKLILNDGNQLAVIDIQ